MKKMLAKIACLLLSTVMSMAVLGACNNGGNANDVQFWVYGSSAQLNMYSELCDEFNRTYGKEHGYEVHASQKPNGSYTQTVLITAGSDSGPDVWLSTDGDFKTYCVGNYMEPIDEEMEAITDIDMGDIMYNSYHRMRFNLETNTSNDDDPLWGLPIDAQPTAMYYNVSMFETMGIDIISVDEENMDAWNKNEIPDRNGKYRRDFPRLASMTEDVPAKGYFRSISPYYYNGAQTKDWEKPISSEILVFNNRIACNWDELEDLAMTFTGSYNPRPGDEAKEVSNRVTVAGTKYGYFTEWWFNYGWGVGGDCLNDLTGQGEWNFSLLDPNPNYVVQPGENGADQTFTGRTGKVYHTGETIGFIDKMNILKKADGTDEILAPEDYGDYYHEGTTELAGLWEGIAPAVEAGVLGELPSTREAFNRYLKLGATKDANIDGEAGLDISPNPQTINARGSMNWFFSQELALHVNTSAYMFDLADQANRRGFKWDVAPMIVYKEYTDPADPYCDEVKVRGKAAGHSNAISMLIRRGTKNKRHAVEFMMWAAGQKGQELRASLGFFPNQKSLINEIQFPSGVASDNVVAFSEALESQGPGDWWYLPDHVWVEKWCVDLNASVRNGLMTYDEWLEGTHKNSVPGGKCVVRTNDWLKENYSGTSRA